MSDTLPYQDLPLDHPITAVVLRIGTTGLIVQLPDGREGLIRERELGWDAGERQGWMTRYRPGTEVRVVPLGKGDEQRLELSLRLAQSDCWRTIRDRYPIGSLVDGVVTGIMPYGVFVELEPSITGLLHVSRLPSWAQKPPAELFWPGDRVKVIIDSIDLQRRRIGLSMANLLILRWRDEQPMGKAPRLRSERPAANNGAELALDTLLRRLPQSVLVVEDDHTQCRAIAEWLRHVGQKAQEADSAEEALKLISVVHPDLVLMDVGLQGMDGIEAVRQIKERWPEIRCALMTDWGRAERRAAQLQPLRQRGVMLLIKPLLPEDLLTMLMDSDKLPVPASQSDPVSSLAHLTLERPKTLAAEVGQGDLAALLQRLLTTTRADKVVLFELDVEGRQVKVSEQRGAIPLHLTALPELIHSPVRDAAEDGKVVSARSAAESAGRYFAHLRPLLNFEACLGVPVPAGLRKRYAVFVFFNRSIGLTDNLQLLVEAVAVAIGALLERRQLLQQATELNRITITGQLARALVHSINGRLNPFNLTLQRLQTACNQLEECLLASPVVTGEIIHQAHQELQTLKQQAEALTRTTRSFSYMTRSGQEEIIVLDDIVGEVVEILDDEATRARVRIVVSSPSRLYFTRTQVTHLQQAIVNLVLNAIQQIHLLRPETGGQIVIRLGQTSGDGKNMVQVQVEDDGPGIHRRLWERIFDMDYTTRPGGSGLGLYLSRSLIEAQGGRVFVADSRILWGTSFIVELPYRT